VLILIAVISPAEWNYSMSKKHGARAADTAASCVSPDPGPKIFLTRRGTLLAGGIILLAALAAYHNSFSGSFMMDDQFAITDNPTIRQLGTSLFPPGTCTTGGRPLINLTFALNYALGGMQVWGYHAFNLFIHMLAGLTLFGIVRRTLLRPALAGLRRARPAAPNSNQAPIFADATPLALAVAVIWVVHPLQTEAVTYISQRAESLMGLFYLLTLYCFIRSVDETGQRPEARGEKTEDTTSASGAQLSTPCPPTPWRRRIGSRLWCAASVLACLLGVMSKEIIVTAPAMVFLYDRTFVAGSFRKAWRQRWRYYLGLAGTWLLLARLMIGLGQRGVGFDSGLGPWWRYALNSCRTVVLYCKLTCWPHPLIFDYGLDVIEHVTEAVPYVLAVVALLTAVVMALRYQPILGFAGAWFFTIIAPTTSVVPVFPVGEHRLYLSLAAAVALGVLGLHRLVGRRGLIVCAATAAGLGWLSVQRNEDYRSELAIWSDSVAKCPDNWHAHNNLGNVLLAIPGRVPDAIAEYQTALRLKPDWAEAHYNLAMILSRTPGYLSEAIAEYKTAIRIKPKLTQAHYNLAATLARIPGRLPEVISEYKAVIQIDPDFAQAHDYLGSALLEAGGRLDEVISEYEKAIRLRPDFVQTHYNLAVVLARFPDRRPEAITEYEAAIRIKPDFAEAHNNLGDILAQIPGRRPEAITEYEAAIRTKPDFAEAHNNLGSALVRTGDRQAEAINEYKAAIQIRPGFAQAHYNLATVLAPIPDRRSEAMAEFQTAIGIEPNFAEAHNGLGVALERIPGRLPDAIAHFEAAVRLKPDFAEAMNNLTVAKQRLMDQVH
jgi:tetratricopeptide (TPR) repeat protein